MDRSHPERLIEDGPLPSPTPSVSKDSADRRGHFWTHGKQISPWFISLVMHVGLLILLGLIVIRVNYPESLQILDFSTEEPMPEPVSLQPAVEAADTEPEINARPVLLDRMLDEVTEVALQNELDWAPHHDQIPDDFTLGVELDDLLAATGLRVGGGLAGREPAMRARLALSRGGTRASEKAVARGLKWLAAHQREDGSWHFDLTKHPVCQGKCSHSGSINSTTAATALALLPFLGAGHTHQEGQHHVVVNRGIYYLANRMIMTENGGDLSEKIHQGSMYGHALATLALCESYAMTGDDSLESMGQSAIDFIVYAQHSAGGWRYLPQQPGDTTVTGWQLMALKSGQLAGLEVPRQTWYDAMKFLDSVQSDQGAYYGYQQPERNKTMTSIGLLCRMLFGWPRKHQPLKRGVIFLSKKGPSTLNMYFNYYATQVLHHYDGPIWRKWNEKMRHFLVKNQQLKGHERGSWQFLEPNTKTAGRLYNTAMAIMILEVYYRHMPLYSNVVYDDGL